MAGTDYPPGGFHVGEAFVKISPDVTGFAGELQAQVGNAMTGPQADQAEADRIYIEKTVVSAEEIRQIRYGLPPRPPLPPDGPALSGGFPDDSRLTITLPAEMANGVNQQIRVIGTRWREIFPGLQAVLATIEGAPLDPATVLFRLTPDDQPHD